MPLAVDVQAVTPSDLAALADEWRALERVSPASFYLGYDWLSAWAEVYAPARLLLVRIADQERTAALGLVESASRGRWRFAGGLVTAQRGLLCARGGEHAAWAALSEWLLAHPRDWSSLAGAGAARGAAALPGAALAPEPWLRVGLPRSFDDYLDARSPAARKSHKQKLRRLEQAGAEVREVDPSQRGEALRAFLALHLRRAASKGERHPQMDGRLLDLLEAAAMTPSLELRLFELVADGGRQGVSVRLDHRNVGYFYNSGIDPQAARIGPGIVLELASIRDAIARGLSEFDLGPGDYRYKHELGGRAEERYGVRAASPTLRGRALGATARARERLRASRTARRLVARARAARPGS